MEELLVPEQQPVFLAGCERFVFDAASNAKRLQYYHARLLACA